MADPIRVWLTAGYESAAIEAEPALDVRTLSRKDQAELEPTALRDVDAYVGYRPDLPAAAFEAVGADADLSFVMRPSAGFDNLDVAAATANDVVVVHAPQGPRDSVVEGVVGMMLSCARGLHAHTVRVRERGFDGRDEPPAFELANATVGILGLGQIGRRLAEFLGYFGTTLQAYDPYVDGSRAAALDVDLVPLQTLLETSDFVTIHVPLTDETHHMLGEDEFRAMNGSAFLINAARGGIYPDGALARAVREGWIAGAAVDVFEDEPAIGSNPLLDLPPEDALLTPHILGNATADARRRVHDLVEEALLCIARGDHPPNILNPDVYDEPVPEDRISDAYRPA